MNQIPGIPSTIKKPGFYGAYNTSGRSGLGGFAQKLLLIGQGLSSGTVAALVPTQAFSPSDAATYWGRGSILHRMFLAAAEQWPDLAPFGISLADAGSSIAATKTVTLSGTATANGSLLLYVANTRVEIGVLIGDTAAVAATALAAAINAQADLPMTAAAAAGVITLTARNKGTIGNAIALSAVVGAAGLTAVIAVGTAGSVDPDIQTALDAVFPDHYAVIVPQLCDATPMGALKAHLEAVSNAVEQRPGRAFGAVTGAAKAVSTQTTLATGINHERAHILYLPGARKMPCEIAAAAGAEVAVQTDPARPFDGAVLRGVDGPASSLRLSRSEQEALLAGGVTPLEVNSAGEVEIVRLVTTRTTSAGVTDYKLLDTTTMGILDYYRQEVRAAIKTKFPRAKLNDITLSEHETAAYDVALRLEDLEILQKVADYKTNFKAERDPNTPGRVLLRVPSPVVPGHHQTFASFELIIL